MAHFKLPELAFEIMQLFATDIPKDDLKTLIDKTYTVQAFGNPDITPVRTLQRWHQNHRVIKRANTGI